MRIFSISVLLSFSARITGVSPLLSGTFQQSQLTDQVDNVGVVPAQCPEQRSEALPVCLIPVHPVIAQWKG